MEHKRIQKLLLTQYNDFSDTVLIESPFAETRRDGHGLREVAIGLTPTKLVVAVDVLKDDGKFLCLPNLDHSIESLELASVYSLDDVNLSVFHRKRRKTLKARLADGRVHYYELGGMDKRDLFWKMWCEKINAMLSDRSDGSSLSEVTVASSSSSSTLNSLLLDPDFDRKKNPNVSLLEHNCNVNNGLSSWTRKDIYLGPHYQELGPNFYTPLSQSIRGEFESLEIQMFDQEFIRDYSLLQKRPSNEICNETIFTNADRGSCLIENRENMNHHRRVQIDEKPLSYSYQSRSAEYSIMSQRQSSESSRYPLVPKLSRIGFGIEEKCTSGLYLPDGTGPRSLKRKKSIDFYELVESGVAVWEKHAGDRTRRRLRRYGLSTAAHFLHAFGPWSVQPGDKISVQSGRSSSLVTLRRQAVDPELRLPVSKKQLISSISVPSLMPGISAPTSQIVLFWTPQYWYRPTVASAAYRDLRKHLELLRTKNPSSNKKAYHSSKLGAASGILLKIFSSRETKLKTKNSFQYESAKNDLRKLLRMNFQIRASDLKSLTIAQQLTLIDRDLFLRIPTSEIHLLACRKSSVYAPNFGAWIAFSHRISCLIANEILAVPELRMRARMVARFINAANKCYTMRNFQSCWSILVGLQSLSIYRLKTTWFYVKIHHSLKYRTLTTLCKIFKNPRSKAYKLAWITAEKSPPLIPYVGDVLIRILGLNNFDKLEKKNLKINVRENWNGGSTFLTDKCVTFNRIENQRKSSKKFPHKIRLLKNVFSIAVFRRLSYSPIKTPRKDIYWAARQLILAAKFYYHWRTVVITRKIIKQRKMWKPVADKQTRISNVILWFIDCQRFAQGYRFPYHFLAAEYLLKTRYREDKENYSMSKKLEPSLKIEKMS